MELDTKLKIAEIVKSKNIAELLSDEDLRVIGNAVQEEFQIDVNSRSDWEQKMADAMKLALQVMEVKTFPWEGASNVKFPIVTLAAMQYQARAYPSLIPSTNVVKVRTFGDDPNGEKAQRATRVADYMSYQVLEEDECWEENTDRVLISQAIIGCAFKKSYFDSALQHNVSEHVLAKDLYIPYFAKSLEKASRITQILYCSENDLVQRNRMGLYLEYTKPIPTEITTVNPLTEAEQEAQGVHPSANDPSASIELLEQHRYLDLDQDGYQEPYIVTVCKETNQVLRIVARFFSKDIQKNRDGEIMYIQPLHYYTKFAFIPSPDGGIYDLGFGVLLGPLNESINTILNQLVDAGTLANTAGGFLGRGVKFRSGDNAFKPFEWKRMDSTGDDLNKGIFPLPVREPSQVLFQLLGLLIDYGERIGMAVDPLVGVNPGQNTPAETSRNMIAEGQRVFSAVFKRTYRALKEEFRKLYRLNGIYLNDENHYSGVNGYSVAVRKDFLGEGKEICPAADPDLVTDEQKIQQAMLLKAAAAAAPQLYKAYEVEKQYLQAIKIPNIEAVMPDPNGPNAIKPVAPPPDPSVIVEGMKQEFNKLKLKSDLHLKMFDLMQEIEYLRAEIVQKESAAALNMAQAEGISEGHQIAAMQQAVALMKQKQDGLIKALEVLRDLTMQEKELKVDNTSGVAGVEA